MSTRPPLVDLSALADRSRERFESFAARFAAGARKAAPPALTDDYWPSLRDLFTRGLTHQGLRELVQQETQDTFRFLTRQVDLADLAPHPWYVRYPKSLWRFFLAIAWRLSPWRRVLFAGAVFVLALGWLRFSLDLAAFGPFSLRPLLAGQSWVISAATVLFFLLALELRDKLTLKGDLEVARQIQFGLLPFEPFDRDGVTHRHRDAPGQHRGRRLLRRDRPRRGRGSRSRSATWRARACRRLCSWPCCRAACAPSSAPASAARSWSRSSTRTCARTSLRTGSSRSSTRSSTRVTFALRYVNAGHNPPFLLSAGERPARLAATAMALGVTMDTTFPSMSLALEPGDRLLLYTDGVTEAENRRDQDYGEPRLGAYLEAHRGDPGRQLIDGVVADVLRFCDTARPRDDMTLMCVDSRRSGSPTPP